MKTKQKIYWLLSGTAIHIFLIAFDFIAPNSFLNIRRLYKVNDDPISNLDSLLLTIFIAIILGIIIFTVKKKFSRNEFDKQTTLQSSIYFASGFITVHLVLFAWLWWALKNFQVL